MVAREGSRVSSKIVYDNGIDDLSSDSHHLWEQLDRNRSGTVVGIVVEIY